MNSLLRFDFVRAAVVVTALVLVPAAGYSGQEQDSEVVAELATGRVFVIVGKDGIVVGALPEAAEAGARAPVFVRVGERRVLVLLGAVEWKAPSGIGETVRMEREFENVLGQIRGGGGGGPGKLAPDTTNDIEQIGLAILEPLRAAAGRLHQQVGLTPNSPILEVVMAGFAEGYGPEVWKISYRMIQEPLRGAYFRTRVPRPKYEQLYPPEKGEPRTVMEIAYPPESALLGLVAKLDQDARLARIRSSDQQMTKAGNALVKGESHKVLAADHAALLRALFGAVAEANAQPVLGVINFQGPMEWPLPPAPQQTAEDEKRRDPNAPTLRKKPPER